MAPSQKTAAASGCGGGDGCVPAMVGAAGNAIPDDGTDSLGWNYSQSISDDDSRTTNEHASCCCLCFCNER